MLGTDQIATALAAAQLEFDAFGRAREVTVKSDKGNYKFAYAPLDVILSAIRPVLSRHGLALTGVTIMEGRTLVAVSTRLLHSSGQSLECVVPVVLSDRPKNQDVGSALTYARRYGVTTLLCLAADDDDDANQADGNQVQSSRDKRPPAPVDNARHAAEAAYRGATLTLKEVGDAGQLKKWQADHADQVAGLPEKGREAIAVQVVAKTSEITRRGLAFELTKVVNGSMLRNWLADGTAARATLTAADKAILQGLYEARRLEMSPVPKPVNTAVAADDDLPIAANDYAMKDEAAA